MGLTEIVILVIGGLFFVISFFLPDGKKSNSEIDESKIKELVDKEIESARTRIDDMVEETVNYSVEKTERALEKLSNEKIMAVDEYSQTVLKKINDNHQEAVFLYDMLNDKDEKIKDAGEKLTNAVKSAETVATAVSELKAEEPVKQEKEEVKEAPAAKPEPEPAPAFVPFIPKHYEVKDGQAVPVDPEPAAETKTAKKPAKQKAKKAVAEHKPVVNESSDEIPEIRSEYDGRKNSNEIIKRMHEEGKTNMQIAKELGLGVGEVKLVIDLFASKKDRQ